MAAAGISMGSVQAGANKRKGAKERGEEVGAKMSIVLLRPTLSIIECNLSKINLSGMFAKLMP